jgi:intein/homing endonuclease
MAEGERVALPELNISPEKVCYILIKAREFDAKVEPVETDPGSNPVDSGMGEILEDHADDPTIAELRAAINGLNDDEVIDLIALAWLGRGDFSKDGWEEARALARERHRRRSASYLMGMPALGDYLEEGLAALGLTCEAYEIGRL